MIRKIENLIIPEKYDYVRGKKPKVECILCEYTKGSNKVSRLEIKRGKYMIIGANLYPYNPGHILIFPIKHINDVRELDSDEWAELINFQNDSLEVLERLYSPSGFNIGFNIGTASGASIVHLHLHIVPRYKSETGFMDIISGTRTYVEDPIKTMERLKKAFSEL